MPTLQDLLAQARGEPAPGLQGLGGVPPLANLIRPRPQPQTPDLPALARLLAFRQQRPDFLTRLGMGGGLGFQVSPNQMGRRHRGANTARQVLRGLVGGVDRAAAMKGAEYQREQKGLETDVGAEQTRESFLARMMNQLRDDQLAQERASESLRWHNLLDTNADLTRQLGERRQGATEEWREFLKWLRGEQLERGTARDAATAADRARRTKVAEDAEARKAQAKGKPKSGAGGLVDKILEDYHAGKK